VGTLVLDIKKMAYDGCFFFPGDQVTTYVGELLSFVVVVVVVVVFNGIFSCFIRCYSGRVADGKSSWM